MPSSGAAGNVVWPGARLFLVVSRETERRLPHEHPDLMALVELIDIDENEALAKKHRIRAVPTFVRPDGERRVGGMPLTELRAFLRAT